MDLIDTSYPLHWPEGWPRRPYHRIGRAKFDRQRRSPQVPRCHRCGQGCFGRLGNGDGRALCIPCGWLPAGEPLPGEP
jgi:hypothetical protein